MDPSIHVLDPFPRSPCARAFADRPGCWGRLQFAWCGQPSRTAPGRPSRRSHKPASLAPAARPLFQTRYRETSMSALPPRANGPPAQPLIPADGCFFPRRPAYPKVPFPSSGVSIASPPARPSLSCLERQGRAAACDVPTPAPVPMRPQRHTHTSHTSSCSPQRAPVRSFAHDGALRDPDPTRSPRAGRALRLDPVTLRRATTKPSHTARNSTTSLPLLSLRANKPLLTSSS